MSIAHSLASNFVMRARQWREERAFAALARSAYTASAVACASGAGTRTELVFLCEEFFHTDLRGYGGFGKTVKNVAEYFNARPDEAFGVRLFYPQGSRLVPQPEYRCYHDTQVLLRPPVPRTDRSTFNVYSHLANFPGQKIFVSIDWYPSYRYPLYAASAVPLVVWIHDPRDRDEWLKIAGVGDEMKVYGKTSPDDLAHLAQEKETTIKELLNLRDRLARKIVFATTATTLVERARRTYGLPGLEAHWLPNPIEIPVLDATECTARPSLVYLGRLDPVKRPWIAFELAHRHPEVDFLIAGQTHTASLMERWVEQYRGTPNLKFLGHIDGEEKDALLRRCWGILNTSVHEAEPVSFLEAFSYGKCVVACHDPDDEVSNYGYFTGEVCGEGLDEDSLSRFSTQIDRLLSDSHDRREKGRLAREEMQKNHTFDSFQRHLSAILEAEGVS